MKVLLTILLFIVMFAVLLVAIYFCDKYIFRRFKINKFIPLGVTIACFAVIFFVRVNIVINIVLTLIAALGISWFISIQQGRTVKVEKKIKIKPKAKPNRIKNDKSNICKK